MRGLSLTADAKRRARVKNLPFDLDWRDIQTRIERGFCELSGLPFDLSTPKSPHAPSLDQITANQGYTKNNVRVVLYAVNMMMGTWGLEKALEIVQAIQRKV